MFGGIPVSMDKPELVEERLQLKAEPSIHISDVNTLARRRAVEQLAKRYNRKWKFDGTIAQLVLAPITEKDNFK